LAKATTTSAPDDEEPSEPGEAGSELEPISETVDEDLTAEQARELTDQIKFRAAALWETAYVRSVLDRATPGLFVAAPGPKLVTCGPFSVTVPPCSDMW
jgi:hypothetical protein